MRMPLARLYNVNRHLGRGAFARAVWTDQCYDLSPSHQKIDTAHEPAPIAADTGIVHFDQHPVFRFG